MTTSMREALEAAMKEQGGNQVQEDSIVINDGPDGSDDIVPDQSEVSVPTGETPEADEAAAEVQRLRDEQGKFAKSDKKDPKQVSNTQKPEGTAAGQQANTDGAPATLSAEEKAHWEHTPPVIRNALARISKQSQTAVLQAQQELGEFKKQSAARDTVLEPYNKLWMQNGVAPEKGLADAMRAVHAFERDPKGTLMALAQQYGISLSQDSNDDYQDPMQGEINRLNAEIASLKRVSEQSQQQSNQQQQLETINQFASARNEQGQAKYPHFERVRESMSRSLNAIAASNPQLTNAQLLEQAYNYAVYADPNLQEEIRQAEAAQKQQAEFDQKRAAAQKAQNGVVTPVSLGAGGVPDAQASNMGKSTRQMLEEALQAQLGRV